MPGITSSRLKCTKKSVWLCETLMLFPNTNVSIMTKTLSWYNEERGRLYLSWPVGSHNRYVNKSNMRLTSCRRGYVGANLGVHTHQSGLDLVKNALSRLQWFQRACCLRATPQCHLTTIQLELLWSRKNPRTRSPISLPYSYFCCVTTTHMDPESPTFIACPLRFGL